MIGLETSVKLSNPDLTQNDRLFIILSALNEDMAMMIKTSESVSTKLLTEYQAQIVNALMLLDH